MKNTEKLRDELHESFASAFEKNDILSLQKFYRQLKVLNRKANYFDIEAVDISNLAENISLATDILVNQNGKTVIFCGNEVSSVLGNRQFLTKAILEMISNAIFYGLGSLITVKCYEKSDNIFLCVQSLGEFNFTEKSDGINYIRKSAKIFDGRFVIFTGEDCSSQILVLKKAYISTTEKNPTFLELVNDRLSPVYIELYGVNS